jgi:hypothetical protein
MLDRDERGMHGAYRITSESSISAAPARASPAKTGGSASIARARTVRNSPCAPARALPLLAPAPAVTASSATSEIEAIPGTTAAASAASTASRLFFFFFFGLVADASALSTAAVAAAAAARTRFGTDGPASSAAGSAGAAVCLRLCFGFFIADGARSAAAMGASTGRSSGAATSARTLAAKVAETAAKKSGTCARRRRSTTRGRRAADAFLAAAPGLAVRSPFARRYYGGIGYVRTEMLRLSMPLVVGPKTGPAGHDRRRLCGQPCLRRRWRSGGKECVSPPASALRRQAETLVDARYKPQGASGDVGRANSDSTTDQATRAHRMTLDEAQLILNVNRTDPMEKAVQVRRRSLLLATDMAC